MIKVKDMEVVFQTVILVSDGEEAFIETQIENDSLKMSIKFVPETKEPGVRWNTEDGIVKIYFEGLQNPLGASLNQIIKLGITESGKNVGIRFFHHKVGLINRLDFHLFLGGEND